MLLTILLLTFGAVGYLNTGYWLGRFSWKVWHKKERSTAGLLCFPLDYIENTIGHDPNSPDNPDTPPTPFVHSSTIEGYATTMALIWPVKLLHLLPLSLFTLPKLATKFPSLLISKCSPKELPPAPEATQNQFEINEYYSLLYQKAKTDALLEKMEGNPDKEKALNFPRRL